MDRLNEAIQALESVMRVNRGITRTFVDKKVGVKVLTAGSDFGQVVTNVDIGVSRALLYGGIPDVSGFRKTYPGSFSEEEDSPERLKSLEIIQVDPIDGTGDFVITYKSSSIMAPTTLISKLVRERTDDNFRVQWGIIFDVVNDIGLVSDGLDILLFVVSPEGKLMEIPVEKIAPHWDTGSPIAINRRVSYPQLTFDGPFMHFLRKNGLDVHQVPTGGAGNLAMRVFRNYIQPIGPGAESFNKLQPLTICFNAQPDWKTWDTDPSEVIANVLGLPTRTDIFCNSLTANAAAKTLKEMYHTSGYVLSINRSLQLAMCDAARTFSASNPHCPLLWKDYEYKDAILATQKGVENRET